MKLTITGSGSGKPTGGKNLSSLLLQHKEHLLLLDCGEPIARILAERHLDVNEIEAVVITHFHPDHSSGIYMLLQLFHIRKRTRNLKLFLPENLELFSSTLPMYYLFKENFPFHLEILNIKNLNDHYHWLSVIPNDHLQRYRKIIATTGSANEMQSFSILCQADKNVLYTSDIGSMKPIKSAIDIADVIIIDALHPSPKKLWELMKTSKKVILTHGLHPELAEKIATDSITGTTIAEDGLEIEV